MSYSDSHVRSARLEDDVPPEGVPDITTGAEVAHDEFGRAKLALGHNASFGHHDAYQCLDEQRRMMLPSAPAAPPPVPYSYAMVDENNTSISCRVQPDVHAATIVKRSTTSFATRNEVDVVSSHKYRSLVARSGGTLVEAVRWSIGDRDTVIEMAVPYPQVPFPSDPHAPPQPCHLPPRRGDLYELVMWGSSSSDHVPPGDRAAWIAMLRACFRDVALAVALLHDGGFVHRDIKLENVVFVFVEARPTTATSNVDESLGSWLGRHQVHAQLIDMAFVVSDCDRHAPTKSGTRGYLPADLCQMYIVEIAPTWRQLAAADVFGLGMMMCNALCGRNEGSRSLQQQCAQLPSRVSAFRRQLSGQSLAWVAGNLLHEDWSVRPLARLVFEWLHGGPS